VFVLEQITAVIFVTRYLLLHTTTTTTVVVSKGMMIFMMCWSLVIGF
jgi:hypothetical protein